MLNSRELKFHITHRVRSFKYQKWELLVATRPTSTIIIIQLSIKMLALQHTGQIQH